LNDDGHDAYIKSHPEDLRRIVLPDGTARLTLATATIGFPSEEEEGGSGGGGGGGDWKGVGGGRWNYRRGWTTRAGPKEGCATTSKT
jgi:hypothetical protein